MCYYETVLQDLNGGMTSCRWRKLTPGGSGSCRGERAQACTAPRAWSRSRPPPRPPGEWPRAGPCGLRRPVGTGPLHEGWLSSASYVQTPRFPGSRPPSLGSGPYCRCSPPRPTLPHRKGHLKDRPAMRWPDRGTSCSFCHTGLCLRPGHRSRLSVGPRGKPSDQSGGHRHSDAGLPRLSPAAPLPPVLEGSAPFSGVHALEGRRPLLSHCYLSCIWPGL